MNRPECTSQCIVVTGFGPFGDNLVNASSVAVRTLQEMWCKNSVLVSCPVRLVTIVDIPVTYNDVQNTCDSIWNMHPNLVIHVGLDAGARAVILESQAFNDQYNLPDSNGICCGFDGHCVPQGVDRLSCQLNLYRTLQTLSEQSISACVSNNPGHYLCGYLYYLSLSRGCDRCVFVHVPPISSAFDDQTLAVTLFVILQDLATQCGLLLPDVALTV
ncbi:pyroglutamyl-peptidase [Paragonimus westermani]|uniref:Pyroglutamyl-peptidase n=1 Tax=Paragonimus westermani TaxID=34504 RepID=A0A5J4NSC1_9TREM|nr:pyroglutamyl-peptidase [Paragonimus westermani]